MDDYDNLAAQHGGQPAGVDFDALAQAHGGAAAQSQPGLKPVTTHNGKQSVQREDGAVWYGPDQGNTGKPGWFNDEGFRAPDAPVTGVLYHPILENLSHAATGTVIGAMQGLAHAGAGISDAFSGSPDHPLMKNIDKAAQEYEQQYQREKYKGPGSTAAEIAGAFAVPVPGIGPAGNTAKAMIARGLVQGGTYAATQPITNGGADYITKKAKQTGLGALAGGIATPIVGGLSEGASRLLDKAKRLGNTPAVGEFLSNLQAKFGGKDPGVALQDAADNEWNQAWTKYKADIGPVDEQAGNLSIQFPTALKELNAVLNKSRLTSRHPAEASYLGELRDSLAAISKPTPKPPTTPEESANWLASIAEPKPKPPSDKLDVAMEEVSNLGKMLGSLTKEHGSLIDRGAFQKVRSALLNDIESSIGDLGPQYAKARETFKNEIVPKFDPTQGGNWLTKIRDAWNPNDILQSLAQGGLRDMKVDRLKAISQGASADPLIYQAVKQAQMQANDKPAAFAASLTKALPGIRAIGSPETVSQIENMISAAKTGVVLGTGANLGAASLAHGAGAAVGAPGVGNMAGGAILAAGHFNPALTGQGLTWQALQNPKVRAVLSKASGFQDGTPEFEAYVTRLISSKAAEYQGTKP